MNAFVSNAETPDFDEYRRDNWKKAIAPEIGAARLHFCFHYENNHGTGRGTVLRQTGENALKLTVPIREPMTQFRANW